MKAIHYRDMIKRAVAAPDGKILDKLAAKLLDAEHAADILQSKGYRPQAKTITAAARLVPAAWPYQKVRYE